MAGGVKHGQCLVSNEDRLAIDERLPGDSVARILLGPWEFGKDGARVPPGQDRRALYVVAMPVSRQHSSQRGPVLAQLSIERGQMSRIPDPGVDERGRISSAHQQVCVVTASGHRTWVVGVDANGDQVCHCTQALWGCLRSYIEPRVSVSVKYGPMAAPPAASESFTPAERHALGSYFTNTDQSVFALRNLPEAVKGALFARYSRSAKSLRRLFLDEFLAQVARDSTGGLTQEASAASGPA